MRPALPTFVARFAALPAAIVHVQSQHPASSAGQEPFRPSHSTATRETVLGGVLALFVAMNRGRLEDTLQRTATLVMTGGTNVADIERPTADNRFAYAPAIAVGTLAAALGM